MVIDLFVPKVMRRRKRRRMRIAIPKPISRVLKAEDKANTTKRRAYILSHDAC